MWFFTLCNKIVRFQDWILRRRRFIPHGRASKGEREVEAVLKRHGIRFETQYELGYYVHVDFVIYHNDRMYLVEYDGRQHYHPVKYFGGRWKFFLQRMRDIIEGWECKSRGIPLLRIKYNVPLENIESMLLGFLNDKDSVTQQCSATDKQVYPVVLHPTEGASLVMPLADTEQGKVKKHGQSELIAFARFFKYGCGEIREDVCVRIYGHNYEPDFAFVDMEHGVCIDIEVDEPYAVSGHPTHFLLNDGTNKDTVRNKRFQDAGWYVIRFSEEQIFRHTKECLCEVYKLALAAGAINAIPKALRGVSDLNHLQRWTKDDAFRMMRSNYRKSYLGYDPIRMGPSGYARCTLLIIPIAWQSIWNKRVRKEMARQLKRFFSC